MARRLNPKEESVFLHSVFHSISGEKGPVVAQGAPCTFIRLQGCNLECAWCDTVDSMMPPKLMPDVYTPTSVRKVVQDLFQGTFADDYTFLPNVVITGGEPLMQRGTYALIAALLDRNITVQVETNGSLAFHFESLQQYMSKAVLRKAFVNKRLGLVIDYKYGMEDKMLASYRHVAAWSEAETVGRTYEISVKHVLDRPMEQLNRMSDVVGYWYGFPQYMSLIGPIEHYKDFLPTFMELARRDRRMADVELNVQLHKIVGMQ